jgi:hypothetical protein
MPASRARSAGGGLIRIFTGFDQREAIGWHAFTQSLIERTSVPISITPLAYEGLQKDGTNAFTYSRFLVPELCNFAGHAIFADGADMLCFADLAELWAMRDSKAAVQVVKHDYKTKYPRKYLGTEMESANENYPRKNWSSLILWNCGHMANFEARAKLRDAPGSFLHRFSWLKDSEIGELPAEWNWLADEYGANTAAKILHWTAGIPAINAHRHSAHAGEWQMASARSMESPAQIRIAEVASAR